MAKRIKIPAAVPISRPPGVEESKESAWARERLGDRAESAAYLASVAAWRNAWRPDEVRALLVAESHVAEEPGDAGVAVEPPSWEHKHLPTSFCRLVYCLGYGEPELCKPCPVNNDNGTPEFWDIFGAIAGGLQTTQPRKSSSTLSQRLEWKLDVLSWLKQHGVWLVDASIIGICRSGDKRVAEGKEFEDLVLRSFINFVWPSVRREPLQQVWVIGAGVRKAIEPVLLVKKLGFQITGEIIQPQPYDRARYLRERDQMVASLRELVPERK